MINAPEIESKLLEFVRREVFAPEVSIAADTDLIGAGFDSMSLVRVLLFVENTYGLWLPQNEINAVTLQNIRSLSATIARLLHER